MDYIGIDIGSTASKVVVKGDHDIHFVLPTGWSSKETCQTIKDRLLEDSVDVLSDDSNVPLSMSADRIPRSSWCPAAWYRTSR